MSIPLPLSEYKSAADASLGQILLDRIHQSPFNLVASCLFLGAILHTFFAPKFRHWSHEIEARDKHSFLGQVLHFFGEVEAVFGIWAVFLGVAMWLTQGSPTAVEYLAHQVNYTEAVFVVIIMALASTKPILSVAELGLSRVAALGGHSIAAWWLSLLILAPLLGSLITEPAAMTIAALLLGRQFFEHKPSSRLAYATVGLLFVNISVGGTLTHFAAPPVLMVAAPWKWNLVFMLSHFGWKAVIGILLSTLLYYVVFRGEFRALQSKLRSSNKAAYHAPEPIPRWITLVQLGFMGWTVLMAHYPPLFIGGFLFFLAFAQATERHQSRLDLKPPLLVGFFLAGLVVHGGLQGWWIEPILSRLGQWPLFFGSTLLTAFNDNAAITYLATLVQGFGDHLKYAIVAGAVSGGGLTVIANAPNPAGQSLLQRYFPGGISPLGLLLGALLPTVVLGACLMLL